VSGVEFTQRPVLFTRKPACKIRTPWGLKPLRCNLTQSVSSVTSTTSPLIFDIMGFRDRVQRMAKINPLPIFWGNIGPTVLARGGSRLRADCNIHQNFHSNGRLVRKISVDKRFGSDTHTNVKVKTSFLGFCVSRTRKSAPLNLKFFMVVQSKTSICFTDV